MAVSQERIEWRWSIALYAAIGGLTAWQGLKYAMTFEAVMTAILAALVAAKAKTSNGHPKKEKE